MASGRPKPSVDLDLSKSRCELISEETSVLTGDERMWWRQLRQQDNHGAREQLMALYLPYARIVAASYYAKRLHDEIEFDEYLQFASVGLIEAMERFDPGAGVQFKTFAARRMHGSILNGLERITEKNQQIAVQKKLKQERVQALKLEAIMLDGRSETELALDSPSVSRQSLCSWSQQDMFRYLAEIGIGLALGVLLDGTGMIDSEFSMESVPSLEVSYFRQVEVQRLRSRVQAVLSNLPQQEQTVLRYHYLQETAFDDIASMMGVTRSRVSQIHKRALARMRDLLAKGERCDVAW